MHKLGGNTTCIDFTQTTTTTTRPVVKPVGHDLEPWARLTRPLQPEIASFDYWRCWMGL